MKKTFYIMVAGVLLGMNAMAIAAFGGNETTIDVSKKSLPEQLQEIVNLALSFLGLLAVLYALYGGFKILTAGGEEEGVKTGKTVLVQALIGLLVIFLANSIVKWMLSLLI